MAGYWYDDETTTTDTSDDSRNSNLYGGDEDEKACRKRACMMVQCAGEPKPDCSEEEPEQEPESCFCEPDDDCMDEEGELVRITTNTAPVTDTADICDLNEAQAAMVRQNNQPQTSRQPTKYSEKYGTSGDDGGCCMCDCNEDEGEGGYFFIVDKNGKKPDNNAEDFFEVMNERAGGIFDHDKETGLVTALHGATPDEVMTSTSESHILAKLIYDCTIDKRSDENPKIAPQTKAVDMTDKNGVRFRVIPDEYPEVNNKFYFDWFRYGYVDLVDNKNMLEQSEDIDDVEGHVQDHIGMERLYRDITNYRIAENEIAQAGVLGHYIYERFSYTHYEQHKKRVKDVEGTQYHKYADQKEIEIMLDMLHYSPAKYQQNRQYIRKEMEIRTINDKDYLVVSYVYDKHRVLFEYYCEILLEDPRKKIKNLNFFVYQYMD